MSILYRRTRAQRQYFIAGIVAVAIVIGIGIAIVTAYRTLNSVQLPPQPTPRGQLATPVVERQQFAAVPGGAHPTSTSPQPLKPTSATVDALISSGKPADAFAAYTLAAKCQGERENSALILAAGRVPDLQSCGDLTAGQIASRLLWLERAALAGVHGAAGRFMQESLGGAALNTVPDPNAIALANRYIEIGAEHGDGESLLLLSDQAEARGDLAQALTYWIARNELEVASTGKESRYFKAVAERLRRSLGDEAPAAAAAGTELAAKLRGKQ